MYSNLHRKAWNVVFPLENCFFPEAINILQPLNLL